MPNTPFSPMSEIDPTFRNRAESIMAHYRDLVWHTHELLFPLAETGVLAQLQRKDWSRLRRLAFRTVSPYVGTDPPWPEPFSIRGAAVRVTRLMGQHFLASGWLVYVLMVYVCTIMIVLTWLGQIDPTKMIREIDPYTAALFGLILLAIWYWIAGYWRWVEFLRDERYSSWARIALLILFIAVSITVWRGGLIPLYEWRMPVRTLLSPSEWTAIEGILLLTALPAFSVVFFMLVGAITILIAMFQSSIDNLERYHDPTLEKSVRTLVLTPVVPRPEDGPPWHLANLAREELVSINNRAKISLESSEKRLVLFTLVFAGFAIYITTQLGTRAANEVDAAIQKLGFGILSGSILKDLYYGQNPGALTEAALTYLVLIFFVLAPISIVMLLINNLVKNLAVQAAIAQACTVAEYAKHREEATYADHKPVTSERRKFLGIF